VCNRINIAAIASPNQAEMGGTPLGLQPSPPLLGVFQGGRANNNLNNNLR